MRFRFKLRDVTRNLNSKFVGRSCAATPMRQPPDIEFYCVGFVFFEHPQTKGMVVEEDKIVPPARLDCGGHLFQEVAFG